MKRNNQKSTFNSYSNFFTGSSIKTLELHTLLRKQFFKKRVEEEAVVYLVSPLSCLAMTSYTEGPGH